MIMERLWVYLHVISIVENGGNDLEFRLNLGCHRIEACCDQIADHNRNLI
jgi:hypothetical protein